MDIDNQRWHVKAEIVKRSKKLRITIRDAKTDRIIATLPDTSLDDEEKIAVLHEEARLLALAPELALLLERMVYAAEAKEEPKYSDGTMYRETRKATYNMIDHLKGVGVIATKSLTFKEKRPMKKTPRKPRAKLIGADSNVFNLLGIASRALKAVGRDDEAVEMGNRVLNSSSFDEALGIICEYVDAH